MLCFRREGASAAALDGVRQAVGGGCRSGWGRLLSVANAIEAGTCCQGDGLGALGGGIPSKGGGVPPYLPMHLCHRRMGVAAPPPALNPHFVVSSVKQRDQSVGQADGRLARQNGGFAPSNATPRLTVNGPLLNPWRTPFKVTGGAGVRYDCAAFRCAASRVQRAAVLH